MVTMLLFSIVGTIGKQSMLLSMMLFIFTCVRRLRITRTLALHFMNTIIPVSLLPYGMVCSSGMLICFMNMCMNICS